MTLTRRVVIFPSDVGFEIRYNIVRWRKYLCKRLEAAGIEFVCPMGAHEPLPTGNYRWSRFHDGTLTIEQDIPLCAQQDTQKTSEKLDISHQNIKVTTSSTAPLKKPSKSSKPKDKRLPKKTKK